jgi:hypothetical protein
LRVAADDTSRSASIARMECPLVICYSLLLKMAIEIVELALNNGDFP